MKLGPDLFAGLLGHAPEAASLVPKGHHKQPRASVVARLRIVGQCAFAIIDLSFFAGGERETIELLGINVAQGAHETLDALVARGECELVDQILINRRRVSPQADLLFNPLAMRFVCGAGELNVVALLEASVAGGRGDGGVCVTAIQSRRSPWRSLLTQTSATRRSPDSMPPALTATRRIADSP